MNPIAPSYWRLVKAGRRTYESVPASVREDVKTLAAQEAEAGTITPERYEALMGEPYPVVVATEVPETPAETTEEAVV